MRPPADAVHSTWTDVEGVRMHARLAGGPAGAPVVLVHGLVVSSRQFIRLAARLGDGHRVFAVDLPGFGRSQATGDARGGWMVEMLRAWLQRTQIGRPTLVGFSFGCQIVAHLVGTHPDLARRVILCSPTLAPALRSWPRLARAAAGLQAPSRALPGMVLDYLHAGPRRIVGAYGALMTETIEKWLPNIAAPALVIRGTRDRLVGQDWAARVTELLPRGRLWTVHGCGHSLHLERPELMARLIADFTDEGEVDGR